MFMDIFMLYIAEVRESNGEKEMDMKYERKGEYPHTIYIAQNRLSRATFLQLIVWVNLTQLALTEKQISTIIIGV